MAKTFESMASRNFRFWFGASVIASAAQWMQRVAQDWLVLVVLTDHSATHVGIVTALQFLPMMIFSPWAGLIADRFDCKRIIQVTQASFALCSLLLGALILGGYATLWQVYVLAFIGGAAAALDSPARQVFVSELVPDDRLANAVGLNSLSFNIARMIGPALSGLMIEWVGLGWVFILNALFLGVAMILTGVIRRADLVERALVPREKGQMREGFRYVRSRPDLLLIFFLMAVVCGLGLNLQMTNALMATEVYGKNAGEYGMLGSYLAVGAVLASFMAARRDHPRIRLVVGSTVLFGVVETLLGCAPTYLTFALLMAPTGYAMITMLTAANAAVQLRPDDHMRGRVMALYMMIAMGTTPICAPFVGWIGEVLGARWSILVGSLSTTGVALLCALWAMRYWSLKLSLSGRWPWLRIVGEGSATDLPPRAV